MKSARFTPISRSTPTHPASFFPTTKTIVRALLACLVGLVACGKPPPEFPSARTQRCAQATLPPDAERASACVQVSLQYLECTYLPDPTNYADLRRVGLSRRDEKCYARYYLDEFPPGYPRHVVLTLESFCLAEAPENEGEDAHNTRSIACLHAGRALRDGEGVEKDPDRAAKAFERGCALEEEESCHLFGVLTDRPDVIVQGCRIAQQKGLGELEGGPCNDPVVPAQYHRKETYADASSSSTNVSESPPVSVVQDRDQSAEVAACEEAFEKQFQQCLWRCKHMEYDKGWRCEVSCHESRKGSHKDLPECRRFY